MINSQTILKGKCPFLCSAEPTVNCKGILLCFPGSSAGEKSACNAGDPGSIPGSGRSPGEGIGYPLQCSWASLVAQLVKNPPAMQETWVSPGVGKMPWKGEWLPTPVFWPGWATFTLCFHSRETGTDAQLMMANVVIFILVGPIQSYCHVRSYLLLGTSIPSGWASGRHSWLVYLTSVNDVQAKRPWRLFLVDLQHLCKLAFSTHAIHTGPLCCATPLTFELMWAVFLGVALWTS